MSGVVSFSRKAIRQSEIRSDGLDSGVTRCDRPVCWCGDLSRRLSPARQLRPLGTIRLGNLPGTRTRTHARNIETSRCRRVVCSAAASTHVMNARVLSCVDWGGKKRNAIYFFLFSAVFFFFLLAILHPPVRPHLSHFSPLPPHRQCRGPGPGQIS